MKFPKNVEDFKSEFYESFRMIKTVGDLRMRQLAMILLKVDDKIVLEGLIQLIETKEDFREQECCGLIFEKVDPKPDFKLDYFLKRILENWNKSIEQIPFWVKRQYHLEEVKKGIQDFEKNDLSEVERDKLKTLRWWIGLDIEEKK